jgi:tyrosine-protein kinase Etk/Wzc
LINKVDTQRFELSSRISQLDQLADDIKKNHINPPRGGQPLPATLSKNIEELIMLNFELEKVKLSYNEVTFAYREKQNQFEKLKEKLLQQIEQLKNEWTVRLKDLSNTKQALEKDFIGFPDKNTEYTKNQRFYKLYEEFYLSLMQSKSEFEIAQAGTTQDFKILSPASFPGEPISPKRMMIIGIGIVMSLVINFLFVGFVYLLNNKITNLSELERIKSAPVLGSVPLSRYKNEEVIHILNHPKSMVSEALRSIRTNLDFFNILAENKVIAISSTVSGEGKSFIAANLGAVLAFSRKKVILLDLDMRKAKVTQAGIRTDTTKGVSTILIRKNSWEECVAETAVENFHIIPSGPHPPNPSELLLSPEFGQLVKELKQTYDYVILDTPPVGLVTDGIMAMRCADLSIYIFKANYSKKEFLSTLQRIISLNKFSNLTTLLNAVQADGKTYGYGYYEENGKSKEKLKSVLEA